MKKILALLLAAALAACTLCACGNGAAGQTSGENGAQKTGKTIVVTIFPEYDWIKNILGENPANMELSMLLDKGVDLHSYQPTADDILRLSTCDLFVYVGGASDAWVEKALGEAVNPDMKVVNLLEALGEAVKEEETVEGMQEEEHDHDHEDGDHEEEGDHDHEAGPEYDEHVWLSLRNAQTLVNVLAQAVAEVDTDHAQLYWDNAKAYNGKLAALDKQYADTVATASRKTLLFGDRFPFRYLTDDYGLTYYAAFVGCSAESEASFETVAFLAQKMDELSLPCVLTIEKSDQKIAQTVVENTAAKDQKILTMNSLQSVTAQEIQAGADYLAMMEENLAVLKEALQ